MVPPPDIEPVRPRRGSAIAKAVLILTFALAAAGYWLVYFVEQGR